MWLECAFVGLAVGGRLDPQMALQETERTYERAIQAVLDSSPEKTKTFANFIAQRTVHPVQHQFPLPPPALQRS